MSIVCLRISSVLYMLAALWAVAMIPTQDSAPVASVEVVVIAVCLTMVIGIEWVARALRKRRLWAWIAALAIFALYIPSIFLPLGALGMWGLLNAGSRAAFGVVGGRQKGFDPIMRP